MAIRTSNSQRILTKHLSQLTSGVVQFRCLVEDRGEIVAHRPDPKRCDENEKIPTGEDGAVIITITINALQNLKYP